MTHASVTSAGARLWAWCSNDNAYACAGGDAAGVDTVDWWRSTPFWLMHAACLGVLVVGVSTAAVLFAALSYFARMFFVTGFYHRYFSHRAFRASRPMQFLFALLGCTAGQRGPLWWAAHHRLHHASSDTAADPHSPRRKGVLFAHTLWFLTRGSFATPVRYARDWRRYPELRWLNRFAWLPCIGFGVLCYFLGEWLGRRHGATGAQFLVWGFFIATVALYHATYTINSLAHRYGSRRFDTADDSRNNVWLALLTLGEGWHNNHHRFPAAARQGFRWWEIDVSYWILRAMQALGLIHALRPVPERLRRAAPARGGGVE